MPPSRTRRCCWSATRRAPLLGRLWREHIRHHKTRLLLVLLLTGLMAGTTALYPVVIDHAFQMFTARDRRILYQLPALVIVVTTVKALAQYFQNVQVQQMVLLVTRPWRRAWPARSSPRWSASSSPSRPCSPTTTWSPPSAPSPRSWTPSPAEYATALEHKYVDNRSLVDELREALQSPAKERALPQFGGEPEFAS